MLIAYMRRCQYDHQKCDVHSFNSTTCIYLQTNKIGKICIKEIVIYRPSPPPPPPHPHIIFVFLPNKFRIVSSTTKKNIIRSHTGDNRVHFGFFLHFLNYNRKDFLKETENIHCNGDHVIFVTATYYSLWWTNGFGSTYDCVRPCTTEWINNLSESHSLSPRWSLKEGENWAQGKPNVYCTDYDLPWC
jgi:hypothetical protein